MRPKNHCAARTYEGVSLGTVKVGSDAWLQFAPGRIDGTSDRSVCFPGSTTGACASALGRHVNLSIKQLFARGGHSRFNDGNLRGCRHPAGLCPGLCSDSLIRSRQPGRSRHWSEWSNRNGSRSMRMVNSGSATKLLMPLLGTQASWPVKCSDLARSPPKFGFWRRRCPPNRQHSCDLWGRRLKNPSCGPSIRASRERPTNLVARCGFHGETEILVSARA